MNSEKQPPSVPKLAAALQEAQSIIAAAEQRARALTAEAERLHRDAREQGFAEGFEQGRKDAADRAVRLIQESTSVADSLAEEAAKLALAICESIIGEHIAQDPLVVKRLASNAIQEAVVGETVLLLINPADDTVIRESIPDLRRLAGGAGITVETESALPRGSCIVRTEFGEVDASISTLLASIAERLGVPQP